MIRVETDHPLAVDSHDYIFPKGTKEDNTHRESFVVACERVFGRKVRHLDLGCAGGGLVQDFLDAGNVSVGIDGSDYSKVHHRAAWAIIPENLFTADITRLFQVYDDLAPMTFDVVSAWEVLEHLPEPGLDCFIDNVSRHLAVGGLFVASVSFGPDEDPTVGAVWHNTIRPQWWWLKRFGAAGFVPRRGWFGHYEHARGVGNLTVPDWDYAHFPDCGFHMVLAKKGDRR